MRGPALTRRHATHNEFVAELPAVLIATLGMKRTLTPSNPLHNQPRIFINQY